MRLIYHNFFLFCCCQRLFLSLLLLTNSNQYIILLNHHMSLWLLCWLIFKFYYIDTIGHGAKINAFVVCIFLWGISGIIIWCEGVVALLISLRSITLQALYFLQFRYKIRYTHLSACIYRTGIWCSLRISRFVGKNIQYIVSRISHN